MRRINFALASFVTCFALSSANVAYASGCPTGSNQLNCVLSFISGYGYVDGPISVTVTAGTDTVTFSGSSLANIVNKFKTQFPSGPNVAQEVEIAYFSDILGPSGLPNSQVNNNILTTVPALNTLPLSFSLSFDGIDLQLSTAANSNTLVLNVVGTSIHQTFTGASRFDSAQELSAYVQANYNTLLNELHNSIAGRTVSDPVIGNPQSFMDSLATNTVFFGTDDGEATAQGPAGHLDPAFSMSMEPQYFSARGLSGVAVRVPLEYTWFFDDPRYAVTIDAPLSYVNQNSIDSYSGALGVGLRVPLANNWYLTPEFHVGAIASLDPRSGATDDYGAALYSLAARSKYNIFLDDDVELSIINDVGYYHSLNIQVGKYSLDPDVESELFSNGLRAETASAYTLFGNPTTWQAYFLDNRITGTHSEISGWDEIGGSWGSQEDLTGQGWENFRIGASFAFGSAGYNAYELNLTIRF